MDTPDESVPGASSDTLAMPPPPPPTKRRRQSQQTMNEDEDDQENDHTSRNKRRRNPPIFRTLPRPSWSTVFQQGTSQGDASTDRDGLEEVIGARGQGGRGFAATGPLIEFGGAQSGARHQPAVGIFRPPPATTLAPLKAQARPVDKHPRQNLSANAQNTKNSIKQTRNPSARRQESTKSIVSYRENSEGEVEIIEYKKQSGDSIVAALPPYSPDLQVSAAILKARYQSQHQDRYFEAFHDKRLLSSYHGDNQNIDPRLFKVYPINKLNYSQELWDLFLRDVDGWNNQIEASRLILGYSQEDLCIDPQLLTMANANEQMSAPLEAIADTVQHTPTPASVQQPRANEPQFGRRGNIQPRNELGRDVNGNIMPYHDPNAPLGSRLWTGPGGSMWPYHNEQNNFSGGEANDGMGYNSQPMIQGDQYDMVNSSSMHSNMQPMIQRDQYSTPNFSGLPQSNAGAANSGMLYNAHTQHGGANFGSTNYGMRPEGFGHPNSVDGESIAEQQHRHQAREMAWMGDARNAAATDLAPFMGAQNAFVQHSGMHSGNAFMPASHPQQGMQTEYEAHRAGIPPTYFTPAPNVLGGQGLWGQQEPHMGMPMPSPMHGGYMAANAVVEQDDDADWGDDIAAATLQHAFPQPFPMGPHPMGPQPMRPPPSAFCVGPGAGTLQYDGNGFTYGGRVPPVPLNEPVMNFFRTYDTIPAVREKYEELLAEHQRYNQFQQHQHQLQQHQQLGGGQMGQPQFFYPPPPMPMAMGMPMGFPGEQQQMGFGHVGAPQHYQASPFMPMELPMGMGMDMSAQPPMGMNPQPPYQSMGGHMPMSNQGFNAPRFDTSYIDHMNDLNNLNNLNQESRSRTPSEDPPASPWLSSPSPARQFRFNPESQAFTPARTSPSDPWYTPTPANRGRSDEDWSESPPKPHGTPENSGTDSFVAPQYARAQVDVTGESPDTFERHNLRPRNSFENILYKEFIDNQGKGVRKDGEMSPQTVAMSYVDPVYVNDERTLKEMTGGLYPIDSGKMNQTIADKQFGLPQPSSTKARSSPIPGLTEFAKQRGTAGQTIAPEHPLAILERRRKERIRKQEEVAKAQKAEKELAEAAARAMSPEEEDGITMPPPDVTAPTTGVNEPRPAPQAPNGSHTKTPGAPAPPAQQSMASRPTAVNAPQASTTAAAKRSHQRKVPMPAPPEPQPIAPQPVAEPAAVPAPNLTYGPLSFNREGGTISGARLANDELVNRFAPLIEASRGGRGKGRAYSVAQPSPANIAQQDISGALSKAAEHSARLDNIHTLETMTLSYADQRDGENLALVRAKLGQQPFPRGTPRPPRLLVNKKGPAPPPTIPVIPREVHMMNEARLHISAGDEPLLVGAASTMPSAAGMSIPDVEATRTGPRSTTILNRIANVHVPNIASAIGYAAANQVAEARSLLRRKADNKKNSIHQPADNEGDWDFLSSPAPAVANPHLASPAGSFMDGLDDSEYNNARLAGSIGGMIRDTQARQASEAMMGQISAVERAADQHLGEFAIVNVRDIARGIPMTNTPRWQEETARLLTPQMQPTVEDADAEGDDDVEMADGAGGGD